MKIQLSLCLVLLYFTSSVHSAAIHNLVIAPSDQVYSSINLLQRCRTYSDLPQAIGLKALSKLYSELTDPTQSALIALRIQQALEHMPKGCDSDNIRAHLASIEGLPLEFYQATLLAYKNYLQSEVSVDSLFLKTSDQQKKQALAANDTFQTVKPAIKQYAKHYLNKVLTEAKQYQPGQYGGKPYANAMAEVVIRNHDWPIALSNVAPSLKSGFDIYDYLKGYWQKKAYIANESIYAYEYEENRDLLFEGEDCRVGFHGFLGTNKNQALPKKVRKKLNKSMYRKDKERGYLANIDLSVFEDKKYRPHFYAALGKNHEDPVLGDIYAPNTMDEGNSIVFKIDSDKDRLYQITPITKNIFNLLTVNKDGKRTTQKYYRCQL